MDLQNNNNKKKNKRKRWRTYGFLIYYFSSSSQFLSLKTIYFLRISRIWPCLLFNNVVELKKKMYNQYLYMIISGFNQYLYMIYIRNPRYLCDYNIFLKKHRACKMEDLWLCRASQWV